MSVTIRRPARTPELIAQITELAAAGRSDAQVGHALGMSASGVFKIRKAAGIPSRPVGPGVLSNDRQRYADVICPACHAPVSTTVGRRNGIDPHMRLGPRVRGIVIAVPCEMSMELVS